jgi:hypothetical protein
MTPVDLHIRRSVVSKIKFPNRVSLDHVRQQLRKLHATGTMTLQFYQGGVTLVTFVAENDLNGHDRVELQFDTPIIP